MLKAAELMTSADLAHRAGRYIKQPSGYRAFLPAPPHEVPRLLGELETFLHDESPLPLLIRKPVACVEYVLAHEMVRLHERHHNECFPERMEALMPTWRVHRNELNRAPLAHEEWAY